MAGTAEQGRPVTAPKPLLRGWIHAASAPLSLAGGIVLIIRVHTTAAAVTSAIFTVTAITLFSVSAVYHLGHWPPRARAMLRRIDHADILLLIAGTYTPITVLVLHGTLQVTILAITWTAAALGFLFQARWTALPRWVSVPVYVGLGWIAVLVLPQLITGSGDTAFALIAAGGVIYTLGGIVYGLRRPDPWPRWFGYHEVFHACTAVAFACQYAAITVVACRVV